MMERARCLRMGLAHSSPGALGATARPNYVGPSGNGLVERMKAGETPWNQGRSNGRPCPFPEGGPEDEGKRRGEAPIGAPVRVMGRLFPPAGGTGFAVRLSHRVRRSAPALVGASPPRMGGHPQTAAGRPLPRNDGVWLDEYDERQHNERHAPRMRGIQ